MKINVLHVKPEGKEIIAKIVNKIFKATIIIFSVFNVNKTANSVPQIVKLAKMIKFINYLMENVAMNITIMML